MAKDLILLKDHTFPMMTRQIKAGDVMPGVLDGYANVLIENGIAKELTPREVAELRSTPDKRQTFLDKLLSLGKKVEPVKETPIKESTPQKKASK
mgnify:CR=1 FL=1